MVSMRGPVVQIASAVPRDLGQWKVGLSRWNRVRDQATPAKLSALLSFDPGNWKTFVEFPLFSCGTLNRRTWAAQDKDTSEQYLPQMSQMILASLEEDVLTFIFLKPQEWGPTCSAFEKLVHFRCWVCEALSVCHAQVADGVTQWRWDWNIKDSFSMTLQCPLVIYMILSQWTHLHNFTCKHVCCKVACAM